MKVSVRRSEPRNEEIDIEFPVFSRWDHDESVTYNRLDADGTVFSIGATEDWIEPERFDVEVRRICMSPLDPDYLKAKSTPEEFAAALARVRAALDRASR